MVSASGMDCGLRSRWQVPHFVIRLARISGSYLSQGAKDQKKGDVFLNPLLDYDRFSCVTTKGLDEFDSTRIGKKKGYVSWRFCWYGDMYVRYDRV